MQNRFGSSLSIRPEMFATCFTRCFKAGVRLDQLAAALRRAAGKYGSTSGIAFFHDQV
jgi:hypothetical protein